MLRKAAADPAPVTRLTLPAPTGRERIGTVSLHLIDRSRPDPWVATERARELMVSIWYPASSIRGYPRAPWVSPGVADIINPPGSSLALPTSHGYVGAPAAGGRHPVVLFSSGFGLERTGSTALVEELASHGYVVVTIDHTHDAQHVEFPDGRIATFAIPEPADEAAGEKLLAKILAVRAADTRFTLDRLADLARGHNPDAAKRRLPRGLGSALDLVRVGMFGSSLGGATAAQVMYEDSRIRAGLNLDGSHLGTVVTAGLDRPFLLMGSDPHGEEGDESWDALWTNLRGPRLQLELAGSGHLSFTDWQVLLPQAGVPLEELEPLFGTIDGPRSIVVQRAYVGAWFDRHLRQRRCDLLAGPSSRYPEMRFVR
jgi:predicted dienelactone hydrolase